MPLISVSILLLPIFLIQIFLNAYVINKFFKKQQVQVSVCEVVNSYYPDYQTVITLGIEGALASYTNFKVVQIWKKDIIQINPKTLLLMNKAYIDGQFKSTEIDKRTTNIYDNFQTTKLKDLAGGWVLYDIQ